MNLKVDGLLESKSLEPKHGEEYWDAFSDICLMWPRTPTDIAKEDNDNQFGMPKTTKQK